MLLEGENGEQAVFLPPRVGAAAGDAEPPLGAAAAVGCQERSTNGESWIAPNRCFSPAPSKPEHGLIHHAALSSN